MQVGCLALQAVQQRTKYKKKTIAVSKIDIVITSKKTLAVTTMLFTGAKAVPRRVALRPVASLPPAAAPAAASDPRTQLEHLHAIGAARNAKLAARAPLGLVARNPDELLEQLRPLAGAAAGPVDGYVVRHCCAHEITTTVCVDHCSLCHRAFIFSYAATELLRAVIIPQTGSCSLGLDCGPPNDSTSDCARSPLTGARR
jgi:hypothetical protein